MIGKGRVTTFYCQPAVIHAGLSSFRGHPAFICQPVHAPSLKVAPRHVQALNFFCPEAISVSGRFQTGQSAYIFFPKTGLRSWAFSGVRLRFAQIIPAVIP
jgi:hypothetical protein